MENQNEIWKSITGYEGWYEVSNLGNVKSLHKGGKILRKIVDAYGYLTVGLYLNGNKTGKKIHRLVCIEFLDNPENKTQVNHIDCDKKNNNVNNLEWCTIPENNEHAKKNDLLNPVNSFGHCRSIDILNTETGIFYGCLREAAATTNITASGLASRFKRNTKSPFIQLRD